MAGEPEPQRDGVDLRRVVQVVVTVGDADGVRLASGYRVTRDTVLTAAHALDGAAAVLARFFTDEGTPCEVPGECVWADDGTDIALLRIEVDARPGGRLDGRLAADVPPVRFGRIAQLAEVDCGALGFPWFKLRSERASLDGRAATTYRDSHYARGRATANVREGTLEFTVQAPPAPRDEPRRSPWEGMSGALVWSDGHVIGVVTTHHGREGIGRLTASRVERWYADLTRRQLHQLERILRLPDRLDGLNEVSGPMPPADGPGELGRAAGRLASLVRSQWKAEEERRRVHDPAPLQVRFRHAEKVPFDYWARIRGVPLAADPGPLPLADGLDRIVQVYRSVPSGRLVVLGAAGSGKTILTTRFALGLLKNPARGDRVPVIFGLGSWDPAALSLRTWMSRTLVRDYGLGAAAQDGRTLARALIEEDRVLPVLDGFDELAPDLRLKALDALNSLGDMPLLLTSRTQEYIEAVEEKSGKPRKVLTGAAVVELERLTMGDLGDYLSGMGPPDGDGRTSPWVPVLEELRKEPRSQGAQNVAEALGTPLMVTMARTVYGDAGEGRPQDLLSTRSFQDADAIREHLVAAFIPAAYRPLADDSGTRQWDAERAQHWLRHLAVHLSALGSRNLEWWRLGTAMSRRARVCLIGFLAALAFGVTTGIGNIPVDMVVTHYGLGRAMERGLVVAVLHGLVAGLGFGALYGSAYRGVAPPARVRVQIFGRSRVQRGVEPRSKFLAGLVLGALAAAALVLVDRGIVARIGLADGLESGNLVGTVLFVPGFGLAVGLVLGLMAWLEVPDHIESAVSPAALLTSNRNNVLVHVLMWALVFGVGAAAVNVFVMGPLLGIGAGLVFGLEAAFAGGLGYGLSLTAWGQWVALARIWLPLTGRLPWRLIEFLDDACRRGVLRQAGAVYQFRHAELQDHLSPPPQPDPHSP
ncbi:XRE-family transcriptional regulator [Streptomyces mobaraensis NBRC 13819 = DSM 40847]|uniref:XRE-family transcriptional regulator n=1 Tax=Streptomyces mobaraensis (strain ATCC 29032 / DSM 40847 / JCM 4168 / NBRC 13819 / NCIMB 11159 / IPCR 16-22) TaxID=1223523 RepID=M3CBP4_STRM1|nr:XRE-family transcriptional regulator [Streptomyces mobaraensis NBRC 13819 = DSM 40847]